MSSSPSTCPICRSALSISATITLNCSHTYHRTCIKQQLLSARPDPSKPLNLTSYTCPICRVFINHPTLSSLTDEPRRLYEQVQHLLLNYRSFPSTSPDIPAVYLCSACLDPFIGGTLPCTITLDRHSLPLQERLCNTCVLADNTVLPPVCDNVQHSSAHVWKCRLCCVPATTVYLARVHLCDRCETRVCADIHAPPIECPATPTCPYPMIPSNNTHFNHASVRAESLYFCAICHTTNNSSHQHTNQSYNLVFNPSGALATTGWTHLTERDRWQVEPVSPHHPATSRNELQVPSTNFVSTWSTCVMAQVIDLKHHIKRDPSTETILVTAQFRAHPVHESHYTLHACLLDNTCDELIHFTTGSTRARKEWVTETLKLAPTPKARFAMIAIRGVDDSSTTGYFGAKATALSVSVALYDRDSDVVMTGADVVDTSAEEWTEVAVETFCLKRRRERVEADRIRVEKARMRLARRDALLPEPELEQEQELGCDSGEEDGRDPDDVLKEFDYPTVE